MTRLLALVPLLTLASCAAVPMLPTAVGYVTPYVAPVASDALHERIVDDPQDEARDRELVELRARVQRLEAEVRSIDHGPRQLLPVETLRQLDTLAADREANKAAFGR